MEIFKRSEMVLGRENIEKLKNSKVIVFGLGGVGGALCEALVRAGVGEISIVDRDVVDETNINRQIIATVNTISIKKTVAMRQRLLLINPNLKLNEYDISLDKDTIGIFKLNEYDYVADAIDTITSKILLAKASYENGFNLISAMGTGNKLDPTKFKVSDIYKTYNCPLCRVMRRELKKRAIKKLKVVFSTELPIKPTIRLEDLSLPGSVSFVPPVCGYIMASEIVRDLIGLEDK